MIDRKLSDETSKAFFDNLWSQDDYWKLESSAFEKKRFEAIFSMINDRRYGRVLEIGCGTGTFTRILSAISDKIVALDISPVAIERATSISRETNIIEYQVANIMEYDLSSQRKWDLVVMSETIYYLGWLYSFFHVGSLAAELLSVMNAEGRLVLANTRGKQDNFSEDMALLAPWIIDTYRDLFLNVGFQLDKEKTFYGVKDQCSLEILISVYKL